jgi:tetraacyldisaccharide 4'-kinase
MSRSFAISSLAVRCPVKLWTLGAAVRTGLYRSGLLRQRRLRAKVISIGNITWGGTGKTPFTLWLAKRLQAAGLRVSILTRGYGRTSSERVKILPPGTAPEEALEDGDEVQLYLRHCSVPIGISSSRYEAGRLVEARFSVDVHLLDDGFQHLSLARDLDLTLIDSHNPWGRRPGFPVSLREGPSALARAHGVLLTRCELVDEDRLAELRTTCRKFNPAAPCFQVSGHLLHFIELPGGTCLYPEHFHIRRPLAVCGIGNPENFFQMLAQEGIHPAATKAYPDHHRYSQQDLAGLEGTARANRADCIVMTEKDVVNLPGTRSISLPLYAAVTDLHVDEELRFLRWVLQQLDLSADGLPGSAETFPVQQLNTGAIA